MNPFFALLLVFVTLSTGSFAAAEAPPPALLYDMAGKGDRSFNDSAAAGVKQVKTKWGITIKEVEPKDPRSALIFIENLAQKGTPLIVGMGFNYADPMKRVAPRYPQTTFVVIDGLSQGNNVVSILFREQEGAFLAGFLAATKSSTHKIGFVGGMDIPLIRRFLHGYEQGARHAQPQTVVVSQFVGQTPDSWSNPSKAKEITKGQLGKGVDIVFHAAGGSGVGVIDAAAEAKRFAIGCDSDQNDLRPGVVLGSLLKKIDGVVIDLIEELKSKGSIKPGVRSLGLSSGRLALVLAPSEKNRAPQLQDLQKQIESGKIKVQE